MELMYLGSGAAEGWPALFCECDVCREAARRGGRDVRMRTGSLLDGDILIDFTPDLMAQKLRFDLKLARVRHCFLTHTHEDHFEPRNMIYLGASFANIADREALGKFHFYASEESRPAFEKRMFDECEGTRELCDLTTFKPYERVEVNGRAFTAIPAVHGCPGAVNYIIEEGARRILYAHDTGIWREETWEFMQGMRFDLVSLDCTNGPKASQYSGHMGFERNIIVRERMLKSGMADERTRFVMNHFSHNGGMLYDEMEREMGPKGFEVGYDGKIMTL